jgi:putative oxygen-independent coproporphyrinogen III oxidase
MSVANDKPIESLPPLSLYVHFPWCVAKCPYCDFNSHSIRGVVPGDEYIDALIHELKLLAPSANERPLRSIFFGGGTPSVFSPRQFDTLLTAVRASLSLMPNAEITMEANPGAVEHGSFSDYRAAGINRLSLGVQSFADDKLKALGRIHDAQAARDAFKQARAANFDNINLDLMYALPEQTLSESQTDLFAALALQPEHISLYHLTLEPNTVFHANPPSLPADDDAWEMQIKGGELLAGNGYENYEVSAWSKDHRACEHNLNYWRFGDYLGIGAGAHSKLTTSQGVIREQRVAHPREYLKRIKDATMVAKHDRVAATDLLFEFMLNNLRLRDGFSLTAFSAMTGLSAQSALPGLARAEQQGLISQTEPDHWQPTDLGWRFLNDLQANFLPDAA